MKTNRGWHFVGDTLRDGSPIPPDGKWLTVEGELSICNRGLHLSRNPFDALQFAPGATLCLVEFKGVAEEQLDKLVCRSRKIIARMDATELCWYFARMSALSVSHLWADGDDADDLVLGWLLTGDESALASARERAWASAWASARESAWASAWASARESARESALASARESARESLKNEFTQLVYECFEDFL